jgi:GNAT superfamily N-acetyltransferase
MLWKMQLSRMQLPRSQPPNRDHGTMGAQQIRGVMMELPDLLPDIQFCLLPKTDDALRFSFEVKRAAMGPHIIARWGWNEDYQWQTHRIHFREKPFLQIIRSEQSIGTVSVARHDDHIRFGEFYLFPEHHGKGLGTRVLQHCLIFADAEELPVRLEYLKWNPVGSLYRRHGFVTISESEIHWFLERPVR